MRRVSFIAIVLAACSDSHPPATDRTDCRSCHTVPVAEEPPLPACAATENPHHGSTVDVASCASCHGTLAWCPAESTHTDFQLTGEHAGWDCANCHLAISYEPPATVIDPKHITCITCHWHSADRTDPFHLTNGDYEYGEATCLLSGCHELRGGGR